MTTHTMVLVPGRMTGPQHLLMARSLHARAVTKPLDAARAQMVREATLHALLAQTIANVDLMTGSAEPARGEWRAAVAADLSGDDGE
jgi:hypothetical protein